MGRAIINSFWRRFGINSIGRIRVGRRPPPTQTETGVFAGTKGFGTDTIGGEGGRSAIITTLDDDGTGSLREALRYDGPQVITFGVGGIIWNLSLLTGRNPFGTIDGSTAPSPVVLKGEKLRVQTHDVKIAHIRMRPGDVPPSEDFGDRDACSVGNHSVAGNVYNVVLYHCSL